jgi:hypothetical protein
MRIGASIVQIGCRDADDQLDEEGELKPYGCAHPRNSYSYASL